MTSIKSSVVICLISVIANLLFSQVPIDDWKIQEYGISDGLPSADVIAMSETQNGELIVGHNIGVSIFDGEKFETISAEDEKIVGSVRCIVGYMEDIWVGTDRGLFRYRESSLVKVILPHNLTIPIFSIYILNESQLILGTNSGVYILKYNNSNELSLIQQAELAFKKNERAYSFDYNDEKKLLAIGTTNSVYLCEDLLCHSIWFDKDNPSVRNIKLKDDGEVYWGTKRKGVFKHGHTSIENIYNSGKSYPGYIFNKGDHMYIFSDVIFHKNIEADSFETLTLNYDSDHDIHSCYVLNDENLFIGNRIGLTHIKRNAFFNAKDEYSSLPDQIFSIHHDHKSVFAGSVNGFIYEKINNNFRHLSNIKTPDSDVISLYKDNHGLWVGTSDQGLIYNNTQESIVLSEPDGITSTIRFIDRSSSNVIIAGGDATVHKIEIDSISRNIRGVKHFEPQARLSLYLKFNSYANIKGMELVGANEGLFRFREGELVKENVEGFNNNHEIVEIVQSDTDVYLFTNDSGVFKFSIQGNELILDDSFEHLRHKGPQYCLAAVMDTYHNIWIADFNGIWTLRPNSELLYFDRRDGYWDKLVNNLKLSVSNDGVLWVTSNNGSLVLDIDRLLTIRKNFEIEDVIVNGVNYSASDENLFSEIVFDHRTSELEIEVQNPNPIVNHINFQTYLLEPFDTTYSRLSDGKLTIKNIPAGEYRLRLKNANQANLELVRDVVIPIKIKKIFYRTPIAFCLYAGVILALLYLFNWYKSKIRSKRENIERQIKLAKVKSTFFTQISHDFRTPLSIIKSAASQLTNAGKERDLIDKSSDDLLNLIDQILDLNKMSAGSFELEYCQADIIKYIKSIIIPFKDVAKIEKKIFKIETQLDELIMDFDPRQMKRILYNLISNALKFTSENDTISVILARHRSEFVMTIQDTGQGIHSDHKHYVFDMYYSARKHLSQSSGIGLAYVKQMITAMKGQIYLESNEGEGAEFTISLPIVNKAELTRLSLDSTSLPNVNYVLENNLPLVKDIDTCILLVEDNYQLREILTDWLHKKYSVLAASNGEKGLELCRKYLPDIIISDIMMPIMNGFEMCKHIKADQEINHIPVVFLTAKVDHSSKLKAIELGAEGFIDKPFDQNEIGMRIESLLANRLRLQQKYRDSIYSDKRHTQLDKVQLAYLYELNSIIQDNIDDNRWGVKELARTLLTNHVSLNNKIKQLTGLTASAYIRKFKLRKAKKLICESNMQLNEISDLIGVSDPAYFSKMFKAEYQILPSDLRKR